VGDLVELIEARPMSRTKRWRILRTISHNAEIPTGGNHEERTGGEEMEA
jgi:hypothetical protein